MGGAILNWNKARLFWGASRGGASKAMRSAWSWLQSWRWAARWPIKAGFVALVVILVMFPYPQLLVRQIDRILRLDEMIDPDAPALEPWHERFIAGLPADATAEQTLRHVERFICGENGRDGIVPYEWDWNTWGVADYLPTVTEVVRAGREDCDGRAVIAASLLRRQGIDARLVGDLTHMWVETPQSAVMGPTGPKAITATDEGLEVHWLRLVSISGLAFGVSVFPLGRELVVLAAVWLAVVDPRMRRWEMAAGLAGLLAGLLLLRGTASDPRLPVGPAGWFAIFLILLTVGGLWLRGRAARPASPATMPCRAAFFHSSRRRNELMG